MAANRRQRGVTLPEVLVVVTIIAMAVLVAVPTLTEAVRAARMRTAARSLEATFRAARMIAVTQQQDAMITFVPAPALPATPDPNENLYTFTDIQGRVRTEKMPPGIRIASSTSPVVFRANGTLDAEAVTVLEVETRAGLVTWELRTNRMGITRVID